MVFTARDGGNAAIGRVRNVAFTILVVTPSQNRAIFQSDDVVGPTRDSRNAAIGRGRNVALTVVVETPNQNTSSIRQRNRRRGHACGNNNEGPSHGR